MIIIIIIIIIIVIMRRITNKRVMYQLAPGPRAGRLASRSRLGRSATAARYDIDVMAIMLTINDNYDIDDNSSYNMIFI